MTTIQNTEEGLEASKLDYQMQPNDRLYSAVVGWGDRSEAKKALAAGADPNAKPASERLFPLVRAVSINRRDIVKCLIKAGANVHANKELALRRAAKWRDWRMVDVLLKAGADVHVQEDEPLRAALWRNSSKMVRALLAHGADPNCGGGCMFRMMVRYGRTRMAKLLLAAGAQIHSPQGDAFLEAIRDPRMLRFLLAAGGNPEQTFARKNPANLAERADLVLDKLRLCEALVNVAEPTEEGVAAKRRWLRAFQKNLNSWRPAQGPDARDYNDVLVSVHQEFGRLACGEFVHAFPPSVTALML